MMLADLEVRRTYRSASTVGFYGPPLHTAHYDPKGSGHATDRGRFAKDASARGRSEMHPIGRVRRTRQRPTCAIVELHRDQRGWSARQDVGSHFEPSRSFLNATLL